MVSKSNNIKISISLRPDLLKWVDEKAKSLGISRSNYFAMCVTQNKQFEEEKPKFEDLIKAYTKVMNGYADGSLLPEQAQISFDELEKQREALKL